MNNPTNDPGKGIYYADYFDLRSFISIDVKHIRTKKNFLIWLPDPIYAEALRSQVDSGSPEIELYKKYKKVTRSIQETVEELWPINFGAYFSKSVGATFAIPFGVDKQIETWFYRKDEKTLALKKFKKLKAGVDTGASAGFYIGGRGKGSTTAGAHAGVNAEVKGALYNYAEFSFPIYDDESVINALGAITGMSEKPIVKATSIFLDALFDMQLNPEHYITKKKLAVGIEAQGNAAAYAGLMKAPSDKSSDRYASKGPHASEQAADRYDTRVVDVINPFKKGNLWDLVKKYCGVGASVLAKGDIKLGMEYEQDQKYEEGQVSIVPSSKKLAIFLEMSRQLEGQIDFSIFGSLGTAFEKGMGAKLTFQADENGEFDYLKMPTISFYTMQGEMDYYDGPASEMEFSLPGNITETLKGLKNLDMSAVINIVKQIKYKKRIAIANFMNSKAKLFLQKQEEQQAMAKITNKANPLFEMEGYLDVEIDFSKVEVGPLGKFLRYLIEQLKVTADKKGWGMVMLGIMCWTKGMSSAPIGKMILEFDENFYKMLKPCFNKSMLPSATVHARAGVGIAGGFNLAFGGKIRLFGSAAFGLTAEFDVREEMLNVLPRVGELVKSVMLNDIDQKVLNKIEDTIIEIGNF